MWRHYLRPKKVAFRTFRVRKSASNVLLYMKDLQMFAYYPDCRHVPYFIIHCQRLKLNVDFRGESVRWSQTPSPLAYAVYAFINVDTCERPLMHNTKYNLLQMHFLYVLASTRQIHVVFYRIRVATFIIGMLAKLLL